MKQDDIGTFVSNSLVEWGRKYVLRPRIHRVRIDLPVAVGAPSPESPLEIPTEHPFLLCAIGWGSNRQGEGLYTSIKLYTSDVIFISQPIRLSAFGGIDGEAGAQAWGPSKIVNADRFVVQAFREAAIDPAETYPGVNVPSRIDVALIGYDLLPLKAGETLDRQG